jgi:hypothetical protein
MKLNTLASSLLFVAASFAASAASAAVQTFTFTTPVTTANFATDVVLNKFDTSLGHLDSISFWIDGSATTTLTVSNTKAKKTPDITITSQLALTLPGGSGSVVTPSAQTVHFNSEVVKGSPQTVSNTASLASSVLSIDAAYFSLFKGSATDTFTAPVSLTALSSESNVTNLDLLKVTIGSATAHIIYNYTVTAVPEPETYGMLLMGMGVVAFAAKRKSRSAQA